MADQEPLEASQSNGEGEDAQLTPAAEQLPERIRVHALAKLLGTTSKRILAHLTEMGAQARSPQSSLDRTVAETVRDAFGPRDVEADPVPAGPEPIAETTVDAAIAAGDDRAADELAAEEVEAAEAESAPAAKQTTLFASPFQSTPQVEEPVQYQAPAAPVFAAPLFQAPDAAAAEEARRQRRTERAERKAAREEAAEQKPVEAKLAEAKPTKTVTAKAVTEETASEDTEDEGDWDGEDREQRGEGTSRRRRRGRRGRGRGRGEQHGENDTDDLDGDEQAEGEDESAESADTETDDEDDSAAVPEGSSSRRRRRRRRRKGGEDNEPEAADDDPPNTVVHEREPRSKRRAAAKDVDEVQGISGSTRLEAKRQRRRDGREAGRRRPPILTESEFLARREAVDRVMVVREKHFAEHPTSTTQVAVLEDNILVEHFVTSTGSASMVGNVYLGKVQNVLPSMEAAFVDIGRGRNGVLYAGEVNWEAAGLGGKERKIEQALKPGDTVLVQVSKDPVGHKGARLTTQISLAGRFLVYVPGGTSTGISRKLPDTERKRLKEILRDIVPQDAGVIIRTASEGVSEPELARDVERLQATWRTIEEQSKQGSGAPKTLYEEPDLLVKVVRDLFNEDFSKLIIEGERAWTTVENYVRTVAPDMLARVERYEGTGVDVFGSLRIDEQLAKALDRKVWLPSGGTLVIDRTEAMTVIDVNTGKFTGSGGSNLEETVTRNNLEAAEEIVRQMRLRDIGGMIVVDFIDMVLESNRDLVLRRLTEALGRDRTRHQVSEVTSLGLVQMTRKKLGTGLVEAFSTTCETCHGRGILVHNYPVESSAPAGDSGEGVGRREGSRRRRKDRNAAAEAPVVEPVVEEKADKHENHEQQAEKAAAKRAHPVAMAMAAHASEDAAHAAEEDAVAAADAANTVLAEGESASVADVAAAESTIVREAENAAAEAAIAADAATKIEAATDDAVESAAPQGAPHTNGTSQPTAAASAAADELAAADALASGAEAAAVVEEAQAASGAQTAGRRPARRRVARTVTAPAADSSSAVFVLSSSDQTQKPAFNLDELAPAAVPPRSRPRRRAAGRPAGAPEGEN